MTTTTGMQRETELLAVHHARLTTWVLRQLGIALLVGVIAGAFGAAAVGPKGLLFGAFLMALALTFVGRAPRPPATDV
jgi:uncharacterized membrane protein YoaK (UPF0700 family)